MTGSDYIQLLLRNERTVYEHKSGKFRQVARFVKRENTRNKWPVDTLMDLSPATLTTAGFLHYESADFTLLPRMQLTVERNSKLH